jgi:probable poly-beta-1,6-N-acetyl-D-glucosamine export protein
MISDERYRLSRRDCDFLRVIASLLVVVTHCVHVWVIHFYHTRSFASLGFFAMILDQSIRFTVPTFFFLSGFGLTSQLLKNPPRLSDYYRQRLPKILIPFLIWSAISSLRHVEYFRELPWRAAPETAVWSFFKFVFINGLDYQYYFLIILFQFYLVLPFIYRWMRRGWAVGVVFLMQFAFMTPSDVILGRFGWSLPVLNSSVLILYGFYCCLGIYAAWHPDFMAGLLKRLSGSQALMIWLASLFLLVLEFWFNIQHGKSLDNTDHFNRWAVIAYCAASFLLFMKNKGWIFSRVHQNPHWNFLYTGMAPYTFFVYIVHTHVLRLVEFLGREVTIFDFITHILLVVGGSYVLAWTMQWLLGNHPRLRMALSLSKTPLRPEDLPGYSLLAARRGRRGHPGPEAAVVKAPNQEGD